MWWQAWRVAALTIAVLGLALTVGNATSRTATPGFHAKLATPGELTGFRVISLLPERNVRPDIRVGDVLRLHDQSLAERLRYGRQRVGDAFVFDRRNGTPVTVTLVDAPAKPVGYVLLVCILAFIVVGAVLALRRPRLAEARALATMLLLLGVAFTASPQEWMPVWLVGALIVLVVPIQFAGFGAAVHLATIFPDAATGGWRLWIRRANVPISLLLIALAVWVPFSVYFLLRLPAAPLITLAHYPWVYYLIALTAAFWIANHSATGADRTRVRWVSLSLAAGFSGPLVNLVLIVIAKLPAAEWMSYLELTLLAIPVGLGYAIVRHRVVDIGFVVNRALVFGGVSAIVVVAFGVLEWVLSNVFVRVSHITSTSLELALALGLGFSLRTIHSKVDHVVDDLFFRDRHAAERALRTFAREVSYVTDPHVAVQRAHAELTARTGAASATLYVVDAHAAVRVDPAESAAPDSIDIDDAALVRLRATRSPLKLREIHTVLPGEWAFPMCVRDAVTGVVVLGPKTNGEAYAPDEVATIEVVALALGNALDALQTAALKAEVARVLLDGAPLETLRRTVDAASWARGVTPQPAGSLPGLTE